MISWLMKSVVHGRKLPGSWSYIVLLLLSSYYIIASGLRCRQCLGAASLDECTQSVECTLGEACYIDEVVTSQLNIIYNGGCRPTTNCSSSLGQAVLGRSLTRREVLVCSQCCTEAPVMFEECNSQLCSLRRGTIQSDQCFHCDSADPRGSQGDVLDPNQCTGLATCGHNEHCGVETLVENGELMHRFTCLPQQKCTLLTQLHLQDMKRCRGQAGDEHCGNIGRRRRRYTNVCTACCGDGLCNHGTCQQVLGRQMQTYFHDRLFGMWENNLLNFQTLRVNGSETTPATLGTPTTPVSPSVPSAATSQHATMTSAMMIPTLPSLLTAPTKPEP